MAEAEDIKYTAEQYQQALHIVNSYESHPDSLMITTKITGDAVRLVLETKKQFPRLNKPAIVNKLLNELSTLKQKK